MTDIVKRITLILRGYDRQSIFAIADEADKYDCFSLEITTNTDDAFSIIHELNQKHYKNITIGAGTVLNMDLLVKARKAGARFALSPILMTKEMLDYCHDNNIVSVPGAFSPSEIKSMLDQGADIVKIFPAARLTPKYLSDITAPLGAMPLMVVGGINADNIHDYFKAGAKYAGIGSGICDRREVTERNYSSLTRNLANLNQLLI